MSEVTSSPAKAPKTMSSKLLTMKFMQRAAAASSPISSPSTPEAPPLKRQRIGDSSPIETDNSLLSDQHAVQAALAAEEAKRQLALERQAADAGDTHWVLTFKSGLTTLSSQVKTAISIVETGFAAIDYVTPTQLISTDNQELSSDRPLKVGRRSFGKFNRLIERAQNPAKSDSSDSDSDDSDEMRESRDESEENDNEDSNGADALIRAVQATNTKTLAAERKKKKKAEKAQLLRLAEKRKKKDINLNHLTSISGTGKGPSQASSQDRTCYQCGQPGHVKAHCPERGKTGGLDEGGDAPRPKKVRKS